MPMFEYRCADCGAKTEALVLAGDAATRPTCALCGSGALNRLLSVFAAGASTFAAGASTLAGAGPSAGFDPSTACGGGACRMPDVCGSSREN